MILDIIVILFIALSALAGYKKGLIGILVSLIGFVVAIILAFTFQSVVVDYLTKNTQVGPTINQMVKEGITNALQEKANNTQGSNDFYKSIISKIGQSNDVDTMAYNVTEFILKGASFIFIFLIVVSIAFILQMMLNLVFDLPILSSINKLGGIGAAGIMAIFKLWIVLALVSFLMPFNLFDWLNNYIQQTTFTKFLYENNIVISILSSNFKV